MTTRERVKQFMEEIRPGDAESESARRHRRSIEAALAKYGMRDVRLVGSFSRGTAVAGASDADYLAIVPRARARRSDNSDTILNRVRRELAREFDETKVVRDGSAIRVDFTDGSVDVVPAIYDGPAPDSGHPVYRIPDGTGGFIKTSPDTHAKFVRDANERSQGRLLPLARGIKQWRDRTENRVPIRSLYVELALAREGLAVTPGRSYGEMLRDSFHALKTLDLRDLDDPSGVSDPIRACKTPSQRDAARAAIARACELSDRAVEAESSGREDEARQLWGRVFGQDI